MRTPFQKLFLCLISLLALFSTTTFGQSIQDQLPYEQKLLNFSWHGHLTGNTCFCSGDQYRAVYLGSRDRIFYPCLANIHGERPGWSFNGDYNCRVATGGDATSRQASSCGCATVPDIVLSSSSTRGPCSTACNALPGPKSPISSNQPYQGNPHHGKPYYLCAAFFEGKEFRWGFNLEGSNTCAVASGGTTDHSYQEKWCACNEIRIIRTTRPPR